MRIYLIALSALVILLTPALAANPPHSKVWSYPFRRG
jgi:hypothetical protein